MARLPRFVIPGHPQHIIVRANQRGQTRLKIPIISKTDANMDVSVMLMS